MVVYANGFRIALNDDRTEAVLHLTQNAPAYSDTGDMIVSIKVKCTMALAV